MTVITAVQKGDQIAIACDTQSTAGWLKYTADYVVDHNKLIPYGNSIFGLTGTTAIHQVFEDLLTQAEPTDLSSRLEIFRWLLSHHKTLKENYYINTKVGNDQEQPVDSTWATALIINPYGIFGLTKYRSVFEYSKFWAVGSGATFALGAMDILYEQDLTASQIAETGALTATKFNIGCAPPIRVEMIQKATEPAPKAARAKKKSTTQKSTTRKAATQKAATHKATTRKTTTSKNSKATTREKKT